MITVGQLTHLPSHVERNPFYRLMVKFSRLKTGSYEVLFTTEKVLLRYSWLGLLILFGLVLPPLDEVDYVSTLVRLATLVYPAFFIWSLTRISAVELMQLVLEGHWMGEILASPVSRRELTSGFITPIWLVVRQYLLISIFSLILYGLETNVIVVDETGYYLDDLIRNTLFNFELFFSAIGWIIFVHLARLYTEVRLRSGLLKGMVTLILFLFGLAIFITYCVFFWRYPNLLMRATMLTGLALLVLGFVVVNVWLYQRLAHHFRDYLQGQFDIDPLIFDESDPHATAWEVVGDGTAPELAVATSGQPVRH